MKKLLSLVLIAAAGTTNVHPYTKSDLQKAFQLTAIGATVPNVLKITNNDNRLAQNIGQVSSAVYDILGAALENDDFMMKFNRVLKAVLAGKPNGALSPNWTADEGKQVGLYVAKALLKELAHETTAALVAQHLPFMKNANGDLKKTVLKRLTRTLRSTAVESVVDFAALLLVNNVLTSTGNASLWKDTLQGTLTSLIVTAFNEACGEMVIRTAEADEQRNVSIKEIVAAARN